MRFSTAKGHKVVSTSTAETVGRVDGFVIDPSTRSVLAVQVRKSRDGDTVRWSDVVAFGPDAMTVPSSDVITAAPEDVAALAGKDHRLVGKRVLSTAGDELGTVDDVEFHGESGTITRLLLDDDEEIAGVRLRGVGSYAVVVTA